LPSISRRKDAGLEESSAEGGHKEKNKEIGKGTPVEPYFVFPSQEEKGGKRGSEFFKGK